MEKYSYGFVRKQNKILISLMENTKNKEKFFRLIPYTGFLYFMFVPTFTYIKSEHSMCSKFSFYFLIFVSFFGAGFATMCILMTGFVENNVVLNVPEDLQKRCNFCNIPKPERSHHCKICKKCVLKMDHHCNILSVCINNYNIGYFIRFIFCMWLVSTWTFLYNIVLIIFKLYNFKKPIGYGNGTSLILTTILCIGITLITSAHLYWQHCNIKRNVTNVEIVQEHNSKYRGIECGKSPYDFGYYNNFKDIFGSPLFLFLGLPRTNGFTWKKSYKTYYWPLIDLKYISNTDDEDI